MNKQNPAQGPEHFRILLRLAFCSTAALISGHIFFILLTELSRCAVMLWLHIPLSHYGTHLMPARGNYNELALVFGVPFVLTILVTTASRSASNELLRTSSAWALWAHWLVVIGLCHIMGNLILTLAPVQGIRFLLTEIAWIYASGYLTRAIVLGGCCSDSGLLEGRNGVSLSFRHRTR